MPFINDNFMLRTQKGRELYHTYAEGLPIIDYHCHLSPAMIAEDYRFTDAYDLFLGGDHYKWRQMRTNGVPEEYITGRAPAREKWRAFADTLSLLIGNPLFHWTQLELSRYFGIDDILTPETADMIFDRVGEMLRDPAFSARNLIRKSHVRVICTTDDPLDDLSHHKAIRALSDFDTKVLPTFRPDKAVAIDKPGFCEYIRKTRAADFPALLDFLTRRIDFFYENGCRLADHGVDYVPYAEGDADSAFRKAMRGEVLSKTEADAYKTAVIRHCAERYAEKNMTMQIHFGALRNNNTRMFRAIGPDTGFDSVGDYREADALSRLLDSLDREDKLPKTILYTLNPKDNFVIGTMIGNFQSSPAGKLQFGSGWWFNDQKTGMREQMTTLANLGMLTDSRSFISYTRHEYFRRIFCDLVGEWVENGEYPDDNALLSRIVRGVSYENADRYFGF